MPVASQDPAAGDGTRPATPADAPRLAGIDRRASASPRSESQWAACCRGEGVERVLVYEEAGVPAGFLVYACIADEGSINHVAVEPARQGRGVGRALVLAAMEIMRDERMRVCLLEVRESNAAARGLYRSLGFRVDGRRRGYYPAAGGREDALLMSRPL